MRRRDFLQAGLAGVMSTTALAACANTGTSSGIPLTQWYHQYGEAGTQQAAMRYAAQYRRVNPTIQVKVNWIPGDYTGTTLPAALLSSDGPDIFELPNLTLAMVKAGQIIPLDDLFPPHVKRDFNPVTLNVLTLQGHIYGVQETVGTGLLYYRKSMLQRAGVQPPTTIDELIEA